MSIQPRRTPEVTYTFEGEQGKYVLLENYTHDVLQWVHLTEALQSRVAELEEHIITLCECIETDPQCKDDYTYQTKAARKALEPK